MITMAIPADPRGSLPPECDAEVQQRAEADRRDVDPPIQVETATWSTAGHLDWWVKERQQWLGRVRGADGRQRWIRAVDLRPAKGE
jgi:hypothetical protein